MARKRFETQESVIQDRYKICFSGKFGVGKTTIFCCLRNHLKKMEKENEKNNSLERSMSSESTSMGIDSITYVLPTLQSKVILFDTGGLEQHNSLSLGSYYKNVACVIAVYDVTDLDSLLFLEREFQEIRRRGYCDDAKYVIFRNKTDMTESRMQVSKERETDFLSKMEFKNDIFDIVETSGRKDIGITDFFLEGLVEVLKNATPTRPSVQVIFLGDEESKRSGCCR